MEGTLSRAADAADAMAGVWAHSSYERNLLEPGDLQEALTAAAVGNNFLQQATTGTVNPRHPDPRHIGQGDQWLTTGFDSHHTSACDTFTTRP